MKNTLLLIVFTILLTTCKENSKIELLSFVSLSFKD